MKAPIATPYLTPVQARSLACPSAMRACIGADCAAWVAAPPNWPKGSGRCLWHLRGQVLGELAALTTAAMHLLSTGKSHTQRIALMAINMSSEATDQAEAPLLKMLAGEERGPAVLKAVLDGQPWLRTVGSWPDSVAAGERGVGRSPAGGVGNTPLAKCTAPTNTPKSLDPDRPNALTGVGSGYSPQAEQAFGKVLNPVGARVVVRHSSRRGVILHRLDTLGGRRRVLVKYRDGETSECFLDALRADDGREQMPRAAAVGARAAKSRTKAPIQAFSAGDRVEIQRTSGTDLGTVRAQTSPGIDGVPQYIVRVGRSSQTIAADCMRLADKGAA